MDNLNSFEFVNRIFKNAIKNSTNIPVENITIACTHSHSSPALAESNDQKILNYRELIKNKLVKGVIESLEDLAPAYAEVGKIKVQKENGKNALNFVRHYTTDAKDKNGNPIYKGDNHGTYVWDILY